MFVANLVEIDGVVFPPSLSTDINFVKTPFFEPRGPEHGHFH